MSEFRVMGPPGTGKTTYLAGQVAAAADRYGPSQVFVASFTRAAAAELASRGLPLPPERIGTLHAHCYRALGSPTIAEGKADEWNAWVTDPTWMLGEHGNPSLEDSGDGYVEETEGDRLMSELQRLRAVMRPVDLWPSDVRAFYTEWRAWKKEANYLDFTDLIEFGLREVPVAPGSPVVGFFDEVQDFTTLELALVRSWGQHMDSCVLAGDSDQCIYAFKGATPDAFILPDIAPESIRVLPQSYRVPRAIHAYATAWIEQAEHRYQAEYRPRDADGEVMRSSLSCFDGEALVDDALRYIDAGRSVMFLGACSRHVDPVKAALRNAGVPFHNPFRRSRGDWNPLHVAKNKTSTAKRVAAFLKADSETYGIGAHLWTGDELRLWTEMLKVDGVLQTGAKTAISHLPNSESIELPRLLELFHENALYAAMSGDLDWLADHVLKAREKAVRFPIDVIRKRGIQALTDDPLALVGTIHSVKGGESSVTYVFPDLSVPGFEEWMDGSNQRDSIIRQFYVAVTRARDTLILCDQGTRRAVDWL